jgi:SP family general alpha glucoside:H+ symporter-like MFS transporter
MRQGRVADAKRTLERTAQPGYYTSEDLDAQIALIDHTHQVEAMETKEASLFNCFKGTNRRRLEIVSQALALYGS